METGIEALLYRHEFTTKRFPQFSGPTSTQVFMLSDKPGTPALQWRGDVLPGLDGSVLKKRHCLGDGHPRNVEVVRGKGRVGVADG
jgi:hypothetical protein